MPYVNLDLDFFEHPKVTRLIVLQGDQAVAALQRLWIYCARFYPKDARMQRHSIDEIVGIAKWQGDGKRFVEDLCHVGFLHKRSEGFVLHDWSEHQGHLWMLKERNKKAAKSRWEKAKKSDDATGIQSRYKTKSDSARTSTAGDSTLTSNGSFTVGKRPMPLACQNTKSGMPLTLPSKEAKASCNGTAKKAVPIATETPIRQIVKAYKVRKGFDVNDKDWDKANFASCVKAADSLLRRFKNNTTMALNVLEKQSNYYDTTHLTWNLATIAKHAWNTNYENKNQHKACEICGDPHSGAYTCKPIKSTT